MVFIRQHVLFNGRATNLVFLEIDFVASEFNYY